MRNKKIIYIVLLVLGIIVASFFFNRNYIKAQGSCCAAGCNADGDCWCRGEELCQDNFCNLGYTCQWVRRCPLGCCYECEVNPGADPTPTPGGGPITSTPGGGGCPDRLYPRCQDGSCPPGQNCKKDEPGGCKCLNAGSGPSTCTIQGFKTIMPGNQVIPPATTQTLTLDNGPTTSASPYFFSNISSGGHSVFAPGIPGYSVGYTACVGNTGCHDNSMDGWNIFNGQGTAWAGDCPAGGYVDLWWHYAPCPSGFNVSCSPDATSVTLDWNDLPAGYASYVLRVNRFPFDDWANVPAGDFLIGVGASQHTFAVTPNWDYSWDVQGVLPGEPYPFSGCRLPFTSFKCVPPCPAPVLPPPTQACEADGDVALSYDWNDVPGATQYRFQFDESNPPSAPILREPFPAGSFQPLPDVSEGVTRYARVQVSGSDGSCRVDPNRWSNIVRTDTRNDCSLVSCAFNISTCEMDPGGTDNLLLQDLDLVKGDISQVIWINDNITDFSLCETGPCPAGQPASFVDPPGYGASVTNYAAGASTVITATALMDDGVTTCTRIQACNLSNPDPWWQVRGGDIVSTEDIVSDVTSCFSASCEQFLDMGEADPSGSLEMHPGVPIYTGGLKPIAPRISETNWQARASYQGFTTKKGVDYSYDVFKGRVDTTKIPVSEIETVSDLKKGPLVNGEYYVVEKVGSLDFGDDSTVHFGTNKIILFVSGDLKIEEKITINDGRGFFMAIVGGDIIVNSSVGDNPVNVNISTPDLEGLFFTDRQFITGGGGRQLHVRGSVVAMDEVILQRDLDDNALYPAEYFEYAPDLILNFPPILGEKTIRWTESAP